MLRWRLLLGTFFIAGLMLVFWLDLRAAQPGAFLFPLAVLMAPVAAGEMVRLFSVRKQRPQPWVIYFGTTLVVASSGVAHFWPNYPANCPVGTLGWTTLALAVCLLLAYVAEMIGYEQPEGVSANIALAMLAIVYVGVLLGFMVQLRFVGGAGWNGVPLISMLVIVKLSDIGAYTIGRLIGRHRLAPRVSPGKTIEGFLGGVLFACVGSWLLFRWLAPQFTSASASQVPLLGILVYGVLLAVAGVLGDLAESIMKRDAGYKDSSAWLPGYGGVLDMLDSPLAAAPMAYACWLVNLPAAPL